MVESDSEGLYDDELIMGIKCVCYQFDVLIEDIEDLYDNDDEVLISNLENRLLRLKQHFSVMHDNIEYIFIISDRINTNIMTEILQSIYLKQCFVGNDINHGLFEGIIGGDHKWVHDCNKNLQLMVLKLIKQLKIDNDELLFIGDKRSIKLIETINVCQTYDVDKCGHHHNELNEVSNGTLKGRHLMFLESQILASI